MINFENLTETISSASVIIASIIAIMGVSSWRRETRWRRKYELAEDILSNAYDVQIRFRLIRRSISYPDEGKTRQIDLAENPKHSHFIRLGYIIFERFNNEKEPFLALEKLLFRFMAVFGKEKSKPLEEIINIKNEILINADLFVKYSIWRHDEIANDSSDHDQLSNYNNAIAESKLVIWERQGDDKINLRVENALRELEAICKPIIEMERNQNWIF